MLVGGVESSVVRRLRSNLLGCSSAAGVLLEQFEDGLWSLDELLFLSQVFVGGEWRERAECRGMDVSLFFPVRGQSTAEARAACGRCEVRVECGEYAASAGEPHGVWAGSGARKRRVPPRFVVCVVCAGRILGEGGERRSVCSDECSVKYDRMRHAAARVRAKFGLSA